jgi:acyl-CoA dehydrogenase
MICYRIYIERKVYASEEHKMMKGMIQEFISNVMDHIDEWEKTAWSEIGNEQVNWDCCVSICPEIYGGGLDFTFNALLIEEFAKKN